MKKFFVMEEPFILYISSTDPGVLFYATSKSAIRKFESSKFNKYGPLIFVNEHVIPEGLLFKISEGVYVEFILHRERNPQCLLEN